MIELKFTGNAAEVRSELRQLFGQLFGAPSQPEPLMAANPPPFMAVGGMTLLGPTGEGVSYANTAATSDRVIDTVEIEKGPFTPAEVASAVEILASEKPARRGRKTDAEKAAEKASKEQGAAQARATAATDGSETHEGLAIGDMLGEAANEPSLDVGAQESSLDALLNGVGQADPSPAPATTDAPGASALDTMLGNLGSPVAPAEPSVDDILGTLVSSPAAPEPAETYEAYDKEAMFAMLRDRATKGGQGVTWLMQLAVTAKKATLGHMTEAEMRAALMENDRNPVRPAA